MQPDLKHLKLLFWLFSAVLIIFHEHHEHLKCFFLLEQS